MRRENLGKIIKKWVLQEKTIEEACKVLKCSEIFSDLTVEKCYDEYMKFIGKSPKSKTSGSLKNLIKANEKIHIYGTTGCGKTYTLDNVLDEIGYSKIVSYARNEDDLVQDFGDFIFRSDVENTVFVLEGDQFYWRKYGLVKDFIQNGKNPFIIITMGKNTPTAWITKLVKQVKIYPPTRADVLKYIENVYPDWRGNIEDIYSKDWRKVRRNIFSTVKEKDKIVKKELDSKQLAFKIIQGTAKLEDFDNCKHPVSYVLNWLGYNANKFWSGKTYLKNMDIISYCDFNKYKIKEIFIRSLLLDLTPSDNRVMMSFPPYKKIKKEDIKEEKSYEVKYFKKKVEKKKSKKTSKKEEDSFKSLSDFMLL